MSRRREDVGDGEADGVVVREVRVRRDRVGGFGSEEGLGDCDCGEDEADDAEAVMVDLERVMRAGRRGLLCLVLLRLAEGIIVSVLFEGSGLRSCASSRGRRLRFESELEPELLSSCRIPPAPLDSNFIFCSRPPFTFFDA